ncbi:2Fe-2S iron-sulfur cluster-binding protein [Pseudarthrobacter sp. SLBN-100]
MRRSSEPVTVTLECADGESVSFPCEPGQDIPTAATGVGCRPRVVCGGGGCGACRAVVVEGSVEHQGGVSQAKLEAPEPGHPGFVLMCRAHPLEDVVLRPVHRWMRRPVNRMSEALKTPASQTKTD